MKTNLNYFLTSFLILLFTVSTFFAQSIKGKILDKNTIELIEGVNVYIQNIPDYGTFSNKKGKFKLKLRKTYNDKDTVVFSCVGYKTYKNTLEYFKNNSGAILLNKESTKLNEIVIKKEKDKKSKLKFEKINSLDFGLYSFASVNNNGKIYISGGDKSVFLDGFKSALFKASEKCMIVTASCIQNYWYPSLRYNSYSNDLFVYDISNNNFLKTNINLKQRAYHQLNFFDNELYVLGGKRVVRNNTQYLDNEIEVFNVKNKKIQIDKTNPHKAVNFASFVYDDNIITMGGSTKIKNNGEKVYTDKIHQYNIKTGLWFEVGKTTIPKEVSGILIDDKFYTIGGFNEKPLTTIESWDLKTAKWTLEGNLSKGIEKPSLTKNKDEIFIFDYGKIIVFNVKNKTLKTYRINLLLKGANIHYYDNALYIVGGYREKDYSKNPSSSIYKIPLVEFEKTKQSKTISLLKKINPTI